MAVGRDVGPGRDVGEIGRPGLGEDVGDRLSLSIGEARVLKALDDPMRIERDRRHGSM